MSRTAARWTAALAAIALAACTGRAISTARPPSTPTDLSGLPGKFSLPPQDADGWSSLTPSPDSRLIYVAAAGDDGTARPYAPSDPEVGADPLAPTTAVRAYATIDAALAQARAGRPDWVLLRRGDAWDRTAAVRPKAGRSARERSVLGAWGPGPDRPTVRHQGVDLSNASDAAVIGIRFVAPRRDPGSAEFVGFANVAADVGLNALGGYGGSVTGGLLVEDCWFDWWAGNILQSPAAGGGPVMTDVVVRRNLFTNDYSSTSAHSQGLYSDRASILLEENVFDHNGWYQQGLNNDGTDGRATMFNHNTYFAEARGTVFRGNLFLRASSIGSKFTSNSSSPPNAVNSWDLLVDDNLYVEGEIGISLGGNEDQNDGPRWRNIHVTNNVMMHLGRTQPTARTLGWGLDVNDWDAGIVASNVFTSWGSAPTLLNNFAINVQGNTNDVTFRGNVVHDVASGGALVKFLGGAIDQRNRFVGNDVSTAYTGPLLEYALAENAGFGGNHFSSAAPQARWFVVSGSAASLDAYRGASGDVSSVAGTPAYADPGRTLETYLASLGWAATDMDTFVAALRQQSRSHWNPALTASAINAYVRAGFAAP